MNSVEAYIKNLRETRSYGAAVPETSYYGALAELLNEIGRTLKPKVHCIINPRNEGEGIPDGGLFTPDQKVADDDMIRGTIPSRGVVEVKGFSADVDKTADTDQVQKYLRKYGQVLVTNYWDFLLVGRDDLGEPVKLERYQLAESESEFTSALAHPVNLAQRHAEGLYEYLKRVLLSDTTLADPKVLAWYLASYARDARSRAENAELPALDAVRTALEEALGLKFEGEKGEHFFRSTLVQTLFYGVFSAWVLWHKEHQPVRASDRFQWKTAQWSLHVPMIRALFEQVATPTKLEPLGLMEVLNWTEAALNRVDRQAFFERFEEQHAVQYFYEPFLEAFDPELRKELGVWYTPPEIVQYMVERVDTVLREELGIEDGLADPQVYVLDPACGTGAYLVEVLKHIQTTLEGKGRGALVGAEVKQAAMDRVFGFEILPAPFVVSHLQLGLLLQNLNAPLQDAKNERAGVFLTNSLTGWEPPKEPKTRILFDELEQEREAAQRVKQDVPILVIIGNPPYNGFAGMAVDEERDLSDAYRTTDRAPKPQGQGLNDLYVRFFRMAERRIVEGTKKGVVCYISNYSWLDGLSFTGMREKFLDEFDKIWIDCMNGDKYKTGKLTPEGKPDPSVFSTEFNREGIQVGTAIALLVRKEQHSGADAVCFRHFWGTAKRAELLAALKNPQSLPYMPVKPAVVIGLPFPPASVESDYVSWPLLPDLMPVSFPGVKTSRDSVVVDVDREMLVERMHRYFDANTSDEEMRALAPQAMESTQRFNAESVRHYLRQRGFASANVVRYAYRPLDSRWLYWEPETKLLDEKRSEYYPLVRAGNLFLFTTGRTRKLVTEPPLVTSLLLDLNCMDSGARGFPLFVKDDDSPLFRQNAASEVMKPNVTLNARAYLSSLSADHDALFFHIAAILDSPAYRIENADGIRQDWPRIPLPAKKDALLHSSDLGKQVAALLDTETGVAGVTTGTPRPELKTVGVVSREGLGGLNPETDLAVTVGWGHAGQGGVTMPGKGKSVERDFTPEERAAIIEGAKALGLSADEAFKHLGETTFDIYLNEVAYWKNIPAGVWDYTIGGYQVIKKWLSYREEPLLGRHLVLDEVYEVMNMARRIAAIRLLEPALDANYASVKADTYAWPE